VEKNARILSLLSCPVLCTLFLLIVSLVFNLKERYFDLMPLLVMLSIPIKGILTLFYKKKLKLI